MERRESWTRNKAITGATIMIVVIVGSVFAYAWFSAPPTPPTPPTPTHAGPMPTGLWQAAEYLKSHYNSTVGLVYESEDSGSRTIDAHAYSYSQVYWVYSDNLLAAWALKPHNPQLSGRINQTIQAYNLPPSRLFEVLFGVAIPFNISTADQRVVEQHLDRVVMAEFHDSSTALLWWEYGDTLIYQALNMYWNGNRTAASEYFNKAYAMWDGKGLHDLAARTDGRYANYKLALLLYASRVLGVSLPDQHEIEAQLWRMQQPNGGITSLADLNGDPVGSANCETTALTLLAYDHELISRVSAMLTSHNRV